MLDMLHNIKNLVNVCVALRAPVEPKGKVDHPKLVRGRDVLHGFPTRPITLQNAVASKRSAWVGWRLVCQRELCGWTRVGQEYHTTL